MRQRLQAFFSPLRLSESLLVAGTTAVLLYYSYRLNPQHPREGSIGFYGAYDQSQYLHIARILASGDLPVGSQYTYGLGYPLLGVPAILVGYTRDPFLVPDILLVALAMLAVYAAAVRLASRPTAAVVVALMLLASPLQALTVMPWSSTVSIFCVAVALFIATAPAPAGWQRYLVLGILTGWAFSARFIDVIPVAAITVAAIFFVEGPRQARLVAAAIPAAVIALGVALTQWHAFGSPLTTPYSLHTRPGGTSDQDAGQYHPILIVNHFIETFVVGTDHGIRVAASPLLEISPYLVLLPIGAVVVLRARQWNRLHLVTLVVTVLIGLVYLSFVAGGGSDLIYSNARYWIPYYPYWTLLSVIGTDAVLRRVWIGRFFNVTTPLIRSRQDDPNQSNSSGERSDR